MTLYLVAAKLIIKLATKVCSWNFEKYRIQSNIYTQSLVGTTWRLTKLIDGRSEWNPLGFSCLGNTWSTWSNKRWTFSYLKTPSNIINLCKLQKKISYHFIKLKLSDEYYSGLRLRTARRLVRSFWHCCVEDCWMSWTTWSVRLWDCMDKSHHGK